MRIHGHFHKLAKLYVSELLFSFIFCPSTFVFLQAMFFSYKVGLIMFGITSTLYSFIIYFCNQGPLLFTKSGAIRYIKIFLLFCAGLLILSFPVNIQRPSTNLLFILFDFVNNAVGFIYKYNGTISVFVTYMICIWGISTVIYFIENHFDKRQPWPPRSRKQHPYPLLRKQKHNHRRLQSKPEAGHRGTKQEHRKQPKQTQRNLRQDKSRRKTVTHPDSGRCR